VAIDDTNMPAIDQYGAIPAVEVLRCMVDKKGIWDRKEHFWKHIDNTAFVCACSPPGGGKNELTPRFTRHFNILCLPEPSHNSLTRIFKLILDGFLSSFEFS
jgi:dynein heavy chain, axonemal